jgi:hypothetical protein
LIALSMESSSTAFKSLVKRPIYVCIDSFFFWLH